MFKEISVLTLVDRPLPLRDVLIKLRLTFHLIQNIGSQGIL